MSVQNELKEQIIETLDTLSDESLREVVTFLEHLQYKPGSSVLQHPPYRPVPLGGLWKGVTVTDEDIAEVRREMWDGFGEREL